MKLNLTYNKIKYLECTTTENRLFNNLLTDYKYNLELAQQTRTQYNEALKNLSALENSLEYTFDDEIDAKLKKIDDLIKQVNKLSDKIERCSSINIRQTKMLTDMLANRGQDEEETGAI